MAVVVVQKAQGMQSARSVSWLHEPTERTIFKVGANRSRKTTADQMVFLSTPFSHTHTHRCTYATGDSLSVAMVVVLVAILVHTPTCCCHKDDD